MLSAADEFGSYELDGEAVASVERDKLPMSYMGAKQRVQLPWGTTAVVDPSIDLSWVEVEE